MIIVLFTYRGVTGIANATILYYYYYYATILYGYIENAQIYKD